MPSRPNKEAVSDVLVPSIAVIMSENPAGARLIGIGVIVSAAGKRDVASDTPQDPCAF